MSSEREPHEPPDGPDDDDDFCSSGIFPRPALNGARALDSAKIERLRALIARGELPIDARAIAQRLVDHGWVDGS